ncbi:SDR family NAD(P)-dependent oxidoreductase [Gordonia sp. NPDC003950]
MNLALVTGTTRGMGHEIALDLLRRGWTLIAPVRREDQAASLVDAAERMNAPRPVVLGCDLADHDAVRRMCSEAAAVGALDLVINNAGIGGGIDPSVRETNDAGVELRMAVNAVTPHLIARELSDSLSVSGRIVQVGSVGQAPVDLNDLNFAAGYDGVQAYCRSKLTLIMSAFELASQGLPVNVVHPAHEMPTQMVLDSGFPVSSTLDDGALAVLRVALDTELRDVRGTYFHRFERARPHEQALEPEARTQVVDWLEDVGGIRGT